VVTVKQILPTLWDDSAQSMLALAEWQVLEVLTVPVQAIKCDESRFPTPKQ